MIRIHDPWITELEKRFVSETLESGWISGHGEDVAAFEAEFGAALGLPHPVLATVNGSAALILALRAFSLPPGYRALVSDYGFVATANAVVYTGGEPVFLGPDSAEVPSISAERIERALAKDKTIRAVLYNQPYGFAGDMAATRAVCDRAGVFLIEDSSQALGIRQGARYLGSFGHAACWSFNGNKTITTGTGGALSLENPDLITRAGRLRLHGRADAFDFQYGEFGYNFQLSNVLAAHGRAQLKRFPEILRRKTEIHAWYRALFGERRRRILSFGPAPLWLNLLWLEEPHDRDFFRALAARAAEEGVQLRPAFPPVSSYPMFARAEAWETAHSHSFYERVICLPSGPALGEGEVAKTVETVDRLLASLHA